MSRKQHRDTNSVSLFPFLAVLVCAMGALIFLLVVTTRRIRIQAIARAHEAQVQHVEKPRQLSPMPDAPSPAESIGPELILPEPEPVEPQIATKSQSEVSHADAELQNQIARMSEERDARQARLKQQRSSLTAVTRRLERAGKDLGKTQQQLRTVEKDWQLSQQMLTAIEKADSQMKDEIALVSRRIQQARARRARAPSKYAFIPYNGQSGTNMRPILIECTGKELRFLPEDITLTPADLNGFTAEYNPLLTGSRALVHYWTAWNRRQVEPDSEPQPYVLLLVRPSGTVSYYIARRLLSKLGRPYGYELIDEDRQLDLPGPDTQAASVCREAIDEVLAQRDKLFESLTFDRSRRRGQLRLKQGTSDFIFEEEAADPFDPRRRGSTHPPIRGGKADRPKVGGRSTVADANGFDNERRSGHSAGREATATVRGLGGFGSKTERTAGSESRLGGSPSFKKGSGTVVRSTLPAVPATVPDPFLNQTPSRDGDRNHAGRYGTGSLHRPGTDAAERVDTNRVGMGSTTPNNRRQFEGPSDGSHSSIGGPGKSIPMFGPLSLGASGRAGSRAQRTNKRWGIADARAGIGLERRMAIRVQLDRVVVGDVVIEAGEEVSPEDLMNQVVAAIERHALAWGKPPRNFYWVPSIKFLVSPGGNQHYERMHGPLRQVGLHSTVEFSLRNMDAATKQK